MIYPEYMNLNWLRRYTNKHFCSFSCTSVFVTFVRQYLGEFPRIYIHSATSLFFFGLLHISYHKCLLYPIMILHHSLASCWFLIYSSWLRAEYLVSPVLSLTFFVLFIPSSHCCLSSLSDVNCLLSDSFLCFAVEVTFECWISRLQQLFVY